MQKVLLVYCPCVLAFMAHTLGARAKPSRRLRPFLNLIAALASTLRLCTAKSLNRDWGDYADELPLTVEVSSDRGTLLDHGRPLGDETSSLPEDTIKGWRLLVLSKSSARLKLYAI